MTTQYLGGIAGGSSWLILRGIIVVAMSVSLFQGSSRPVQADAGGPAVQIGQQEVTLLKQLSNHQTGIAELSRMCARRSMHKALRQECSQMRTQQLEESRRLTRWMHEWFKLSFHAHPTQEVQQGSQHLNKLRSQAFEQAVLEEMIQYQQDGQALAQSCTSQAAARQPLRNACLDIIDRQTGNIAQLQAWLCQWYGVCGGV